MRATLGSGPGGGGSRGVRWGGGYLLLSNARLKLKLPFKRISGRRVGEKGRERRHIPVCRLQSKASSGRSRYRSTDLRQQKSVRIPNRRSRSPHRFAVFHSTEVSRQRHLGRHSRPEQAHTRVRFGVAASARILPFLRKPVSCSRL